MFFFDAERTTYAIQNGKALAPELCVVPTREQLKTIAVVPALGWISPPCLQFLAREGTANRPIQSRVLQVAAMPTAYKAARHGKPPRTQ